MIRFCGVAALLFASLSFVSARRTNTHGFPKDFIWGTATASYQVEGAADIDGRTPSIWDTFSHEAGNTFNGDNGDTADDFYHLYHNDIELMKDLGIDSFRFSISWSRLLVNGKTMVNPSGQDFYGELIDALVAAGIAPLVTLYHWDLPQYLQDEYGGWNDSEQISNDFANYARTAFQLYGKKVKHWITFNEPAVFITEGYGGGGMAPGLDIPQADFEMPHTLVLTHARAVDIYRTEFQKEQGGIIGITLNSDWAEPYNRHDEADRQAAHRQLLGSLAIWADPIFFGDYGEDLKAMWGDQLLPFTREEQRLLRKSHDYFGLNHYSARYWENNATCSHDVCAIQHTSDPTGVPIGSQSASSFLIVVPWGFRKMLNFIDRRYDHPPIYVTENGYSDPNLPLDYVNEIIPAIEDTGRVLQMEGYLEAMRKAIVIDNVDVRGYFHWSLLDNFEWAEGYSKRFGIVYVEITGNQSRTEKQSFGYFQSYIASAKENAADEVRGNSYIASAKENAADRVSEGNDQSYIASAKERLHERQASVDLGATRNISWMSV